MIKKAIFIFFLSFLLLLTITSVYGDNRIDNIEIYIVLDKSLSMAEEIDSVKNYVISEIADKIIINGDFFTLIPFYGKAETVYNGYIRNQEDLQNLITIISNITADGRFTDIGNALDRLKVSINMNDQNIRKYMLLITDGKQEAPPESKFYTPDGSFNHEFLKNTKEIQKLGWKVIVLGIGTDTSAKEIARRLSAGYTVIDEDFDKEAINEKLDDFLSTLTLEKIPNNLRVDNYGKSILEIGISSKGYKDPQKVEISKIYLNSDNFKDQNILETPFTLLLNPETLSEINIPLLIPDFNEVQEGDIEFVFSGENAFSPAVKHIIVKNKSAFPLIIVFIAAGVILFIIIFYIKRIIDRKRLEENTKSNEFK